MKGHSKKKKERKKREGKKGQVFFSHALNCTIIHIVLARNILQSKSNDSQRQHKLA